MNVLKHTTMALLCLFLFTTSTTGMGFSQEEQETKGEETEQTVTNEPAQKESKNSAGLRQLLDIGIRNAVKLVGVEDGFYKNELIKILLPEKLQKIDKLLRQFGGKKLSDSLIIKMNRAAEKASVLALDIFVEAIKKIKFKDVLALLSSKENTATEFLKENTYDTLKEKFSPMVQTTMEEIDALKTYNSYVAKYKNNPFVKALGLEIDMAEYVTTKTIDGLFIMVAKEEQKIRTNPAARVTGLLKTIFGK
jgi:Protein of unknown function (DUF4197)